MAALAVRAATGDDQVVLDADDAVAARPPSTVAPVRTTPPNTTASRTGEAPGTDLGRLAELVGPRYSVIPPVVVPRPRPVNVQIDSINVARYPIRAVGIQFGGELEIPDETEIGWYQYGATPGEEGASVFAAHVSWNRTVGPFARLGDVDPGDRIAIALDDGSTRLYEVTERAIFGKLELPKDRIWRTSGPEELVLITCGGDYNPEIRRYNENIVVFAAPVG